MDLKKIKAIIELVKQLDIHSLELIEGEAKIVITNNISDVNCSNKIYENPSQRQKILQQIQQEQQQNVQNAQNTQNNNSPDEDGGYITSPMVGTFYSASSPNATSFVAVGDSVKVGQVLCIIEAMKLMNQIESDQDGIIAEILIKDGAPVEYGQALFKIKVS